MHWRAHVNVLTVHFDKTSLTLWVSFLSGTRESLCIDPSILLDRTSYVAPCDPQPEERDPVGWTWDFQMVRGLFGRSQTQAL